MRVCIEHLMQLTFAAVERWWYAIAAALEVSSQSVVFSLQTPKCNQNQPIWIFNFIFIFFSCFAFELDSNCEIRKSFTVDEFSFSFGAHNICIHAVRNTDFFHFHNDWRACLSSSQASDESVLKMKVYGSLFALANVRWLHLFYDSSLLLSILIDDDSPTSLRVELEWEIKSFIIAELLFAQRTRRFFTHHQHLDRGRNTRIGRKIRLNDNLDFPIALLQRIVIFPSMTSTRGEDEEKLQALQRRIKNGDLWEITKRRLKQLPHVGDGIAFNSLGTL